MINNCFNIFLFLLKLSTLAIGQQLSTHIHDKDRYEESNPRPYKEGVAKTLYLFS